MVKIMCSIQRIKIEEKRLLKDNSCSWILKRSSGQFLTPLGFPIIIKATSTYYWTDPLFLANKMIYNAKGSFFWDPSQNMSSSFVPPKIRPLIGWLAGPPIKGLVFDRKLLELMSWLWISEKIAFSTPLLRLVSSLCSSNKKCLCHRVHFSFLLALLKRMLVSSHNSPGDKSQRQNK